MAPQPLVSVVLPCLNEEAALPECITRIQSVFATLGIEWELVVCDNGSSDQSARIAQALGARVVSQPLRGYGNACSRGLTEAHGRYLVVADADGTYDFALIPKFLEKLVAEHFDFVTGSRYLAEGGAREIRFSHRLFGNPLLTCATNFLFGSSYTDVYCGFRAFSRATYQRIASCCPGMEFNLDLAIRATMAGLRIAEIPITLGPRKGKSKLRTVRDGLRSARLLALRAHAFFRSGPNRDAARKNLAGFAAGPIRPTEKR